MAATKIHRYLGRADRQSAADLGDRFDFELDEADVWATGEKIARSDPRTPSSNPRPIRTPSRKVADAGPRSLPVNVPDWSKIFGGECGPRAGECVDDYEEEGGERIPPHEYLARTRAASLSVHEGIGRTLKGRDLSRVRNAIWKKTGFED